MQGFQNSDSRALRQAGDPSSSEPVWDQHGPGCRREPSKARGLLPEEQQHSLRESLKVVVPVYLRPIHQGDLPEHLQSTHNQGTSVSSTHLPPPLFDPLPTLTLISSQHLALQAMSGPKPNALDSFLGHIKFLLIKSEAGQTISLQQALS